LGEYRANKPHFSKNDQELLDHADATITEKVYRAKPKIVKLASREALNKEK
jgi:hypothetical protein